MQGPEAGLGHGPGLRFLKDLGERHKIPAYENRSAGKRENRFKVDIPGNRKACIKVELMQNYLRSEKGQIWP